jgi:preprotein translocase subunit SecE
MKGMKGKTNHSSAATQKPPSGIVDHLKWIVFALLLVAGFVANAYFSQAPWGIRAAIGVILLIILIAIASWTSQGQRAWKFIRAARVELRKVVWPTRQETTQTTLVVIAMVAVTAVFLWGIDTLFFWAVSLVTGQRG